MSEKLFVLHEGREIGDVERNRGKLRFTYREDWRRSVDALPLSISLPLTASEHKHETIDAFLWGLLPDSEIVLSRWAKRYQVSPRNAFALIGQVGEDLAGAFQFVRPERLSEIAEEHARVNWLTETDVAERLRGLREDPSAWRKQRDTGQFSLAGSQPKTALLFQDGHWGLPSGRTPTTHILKPAIGQFDGLPENEHVCLALAQALRLPVANSEVRRFEGEVAIIVERYDRVLTSEHIKIMKERSADALKGIEGDTEDGFAQAVGRSLSSFGKARALTKAGLKKVLRLHQEDLCQALGLHPTLKYQNEGGPSAARIAQLLRNHSNRPTEDVATFVDALAFNWIVAGTDAHAKNYSLLHGRGGRVRLAPLYDLTSTLPYRDLDPQRIAFAMKIGDKYRVRDVGRRQLEKLASELELDERATLMRMAEIATQVIERTPDLLQRWKEEGLEHPIVAKLAESIPERAATCARLIEGPAGRSKGS